MIPVNCGAAGWRQIFSGKMDMLKTVGMQDEDGLLACLVL
jgi:hypothetical protein